MSLLENKDWFDIVLEGTNYTKESEEIMESSSKPSKCTECGSTDIGVFFKGEPIYQCKQCGKYLGTVPTPNYKKESSDDEVVEEGFKHNRKKFDRSIRKTRKNTNGYYGTMSEKDVIKCGYDPMPKALINELNSDAKWIRSEFIKEYNKIKDNNIIDTDDNIKLSDIVKIENGDITVSYSKYLQNRVSGFVYTSISVAVMTPNENSNNDLDYQICDKYIRKVTSIFKDIKDTIEDKYYNKNNGKDTFDIEIDSTSDNPDYVDDDYGDACVARFSLYFEMTLRRHVNESVYDEIDEFDTFVEGANFDIIKELHKAKKEDKKSLKKISKAINEGKYKDARKYFNEYKKSAEKSISYIRSIDMNSTEKGINDILYGIVLFLNTSLNIGCTLLMSMIKPIATVGTTAGLAYTITKFVNNVYKTNKEYKKLKENNINVGAYQAYISNKLKELEENIRYIDMTILEYDGDEDIYNKYKEESVNIMMNETINNDEIFEEGFKDFFKKIKNKLNKNGLVKPEEIIESGYKTLSKDLINSLSEDAKWINSELTKEFNKIKNNFIVDEINVKYSDIVKINSIDIKENYYKENGKYRAVILSDLLYCDGTPAFDIPHQKLRIDEDSLLEKVMNKVDTEFTGIIENIKSTYNKKHDNEKFRFLIDREYKEFKRPILSIVLVYESALSKSDISYKEESVNIMMNETINSFSDFELDYIFGTITEAEYNKIKEENAIGQMLPQVPLNGETLSKTPDVESDVDKLNSFVNSADGVLKGEIDEFTKEYVIDPDCEFDTYLEASIAKMANVVSNKINISPKNAKIIVKKAVLKAKCKLLSKQSAEDVKVVDAKKRLINEEQEYRKFVKNLDEETKKQVESVSKEIEKEVSEDINIDNIDISDDTNKDEKKNKTKQAKKLSTKDDDQYISNIDQKLKSLEEDKPVKENNEENKDYTRRLKAWEDKKYNLEMKKAKLQANFIKEYTEENPSAPYSEDPNYSLIIEKQELEASLIKAQDSNNIESIRKYENKLKSNSMKIVKESVTIDEVVLLEAAPIEDEIKPIIDKLNSKGYHTKYSSPGHHHLRKVKDKNRDGVYSGKLYSDARLMFDDDYKSIPEAPKYWITRQVDNKVYLDVPPISYNPNDGSPDEAFTLWKDKYMASLAEWAEEIRVKPGPKEGKKNDESKEEVKEESTFNVDEELDMMMESLFGDLEIDLALEL